jgi:hypothetical protein
MVMGLFEFASAAATGSQFLRSAWEKLGEADEEVTQEELAAIGVLKSSDRLLPELDEFSEALKSFATDYETLRYTGLSGEDALDAARFIYLPRVYLVESETFDESFVQELDAETVEVVVENGLTEFLASRGVSTADDMVFDIAAVEDPAMEDGLDLS